MSIQHRIRAAIFVLAVSALLSACGDTSKTVPSSSNPTPNASADQSSPTALAESVFAAARSGNLSSLTGIAAPTDADGDARDVAGVAQADAKKQESFRAYFGKGKVNGEVVIDGDRAAVPILFGPDGAKGETLNMVRVDGRWYLQSF